MDDHVGIDVIGGGGEIDDDQPGTSFEGIGGHVGRGVHDQRGSYDEKKITLRGLADSRRQDRAGKLLAEEDDIGLQDAEAVRTVR